MRRRLLPLIMTLGLLASCVNTKPVEEDTFSYTFGNYRDFDIHTELQADYLNDSVNSFGKYAYGYEELSKPRELEISWDFKCSNPSRVELYTLSLSENENMDNAISYEIDESNLSLSNLKIGTTYYYTVEATVGKSKYLSDAQTFNTLGNTPRNLDIGGVTNARDIGGYTTTDGKHIKQNMAIRCGQLNERYADSLTPTINGRGKSFLKDEYGLKTEIDLRQVEDNETGHLEKSLVGNNVNYLSIPLDYDVDKTLSDEQDTLKKVFQVFANKDSYPLIFHCAIGTDRTGVVAYLLGALLGLDHDTLCRDYLFSNFGLINSTREIYRMKTYNDYLMVLDGTTLKEKTYNYLLDIGMTSSELDSIRSILLY